MSIIKQINQYTQYVQKNDYVYAIQKQTIGLLVEFLSKSKYGMEQESLDSDCIDYFLSVWIPQYKKYLTEMEAYNIVYTVQDIYTYLNQQGEKKEKETPYILDVYGKEYLRLYKVRNILAQLVGDPVVTTKPLVINLEAYKQNKERAKKRDSMSMYEQGMFCIEEVNKEGYIGLRKKDSNKYFKVLFRPSYLAHFKVGDVLHIALKKKIFFIYWEIEQLKGYYLPQAMNYFT